MTEEKSSYTTKPPQRSPEFHRVVAAIERLPPHERQLLHEEIRRIQTREWRAAKIEYHGPTE